MSDLKKWYLAQPASSQILVGLAAFLLFAFILYEYLIDPWKNNLHNLRESVEADTQTAAWMESEYQKYERVITQSRQKTPTQQQQGSLITRVEQSARNQNIDSSIERISPDKVGRVKVWMNNANFSTWLIWVEQLKLEGIDVYDARITQANREAQVVINVTFSRAE